MKLGFGKLKKEAKIPTYRYGTLDICTPHPLEIQSGESLNVKTGLAVKIPQGYRLDIMSVPSLVIHKGLGVLSGYLTLSSEFEEELIIPIHNSSNNQLNIQTGQLVAVAILEQIEVPEVEEFVPKKPGNSMTRKTGRGTGQKPTFNFDVK
jgi:dUTP pyrophosphatase